jgi:hypothetical protein
MPAAEEVFGGAACPDNQPANPQPGNSTLPHWHPNPYLHSNIKKRNMGLKSQHAVSSIKACKKRGSASKWWNSKPKGEGEKPQAFVCGVCRAKALNAKVPKRAHHRDCRFKRGYKKKRSSNDEIQQQQPAQVVPGAEATVPVVQAYEGGVVPPTRIVPMLIARQSMIQQSAKPSLTTMTMAATTTTSSSSTTPHQFAASEAPGHGQQKRAPPLPLVAPPLGQLLRNELERRLRVLRSPPPTTTEEHEQIEQKALQYLLDERTEGVPIGVQLLFDYIEREVAMKRRSKGQKKCHSGVNNAGHHLTLEQQEAVIKRRTYFNDQQCFFTFPPDPSPNPLVEYHFIEGMSIFMLDLESLGVNITTLACVACNKGGHIERERTNWSKRKTLFPVLEQNGLFSFGSVMSYRCISCKALFAANEGALLVQIPPHHGRAYHVEPRFALSGFNFHLSKDVTCNLRGAMLTQGSGDNESKMLYRKSREKFIEAVTTFLSKLPNATDLHKQFPNKFPMEYKDWCRYPPDGDQLRKYYRQGEQSHDTNYGYSNKERYVREIQSVGSSQDENVKAVVIDWTFQALKTYRGLGTEGGKCMFTMKVVGDRGKRTAGAAIVPSTAVAAISHFMTSMVTKREGLSKQLSLIFTDEWPSASVFWKDIFGHQIVGRLGLFHAMKRITDTIERGRDWEFFNAMLYDLRLCFYRYEEDDMGNVVACLKAGTMTRDKHKYSAKEIDAFQKTPEWNRKFSNFIRKKIYKGPLISQKLEEFRLKYEHLQDGNGKQRFTKETSKAIDDLLEKVEHIGDLPDLFASYRMIPAGRNSKHGLPTYESLRPESALEKFHHLLAHFGNIGMSKDLADTILLRGIAEDNIRIEHQQKLKNPGVPSRFEDEPEYYDQSELNWINSLGKQKGYADIFKDACEPQPDNGEVFLSEYFDQEMERRKQHLINVKANKCNCPLCDAFSFPLVTSPLPERIEAPPIYAHTQAGSQATNSTLAVAPPPPTERTRMVNAHSPPVQGQASLPSSHHLLHAASSPPVPTRALTPCWLWATAPHVPPNPSECCFMHPPFFCQARVAWQTLKDSGAQGLGAPRHNPACPRRSVRTVYSPFHNHFH